MRKYVGKRMILVLTLHRRISYCISGELLSGNDSLTNEIMYQFFDDDGGIYRFPINDIHAVEESVEKGIVLRLTN